MMLQLATFAVNYIGHPFNQSITESKPFLYALLAAAGFFTVITSDLFRNLNDWLKLALAKRTEEQAFDLGFCYVPELLHMGEIIEMGIPWSDSRLEETTNRADKESSSKSRGINYTLAQLYYKGEDHFLLTWIIERDMVTG
ncbi:hypothetical protein SADUNF_Sadunf04G0093000 [Salix dunnii]|uniref:Uncharacterized protein n=1 Tax=Salix dunnii TaxID=1413687 RepID=A0A835K905_9ROSI|nr:hypothetical protein SADUNF_Sadunf04G0093000 [Salix dunnii]